MNTQSDRVRLTSQIVGIAWVEGNDRIVAVRGSRHGADVSGNRTNARWCR